MEARKTLIIRILQVLENYSDADHPLTQQQIIDKLYSDYGVECERKAVGRNISYLKEVGYDIESDAFGAYLASRQFENSELRLLIDSVLGSRHISPQYTNELITKLIKLAPRGFKSNVGHIYSVKEWSKSENKSFFLNIELVDEAIERGKKISFNYNQLDIHKKPKVSSRHTGSPYQLLLHNQHYYLMLRDDLFGKVCYLRMDKITDMTVTSEDALPLRENAGFERGIDYHRLATSLPYMYSDKPELIRLYCRNSMMNDLVDWFGTDFSASKADDAHFFATVKASPQAMLYWVLQYNVNVKVISPDSLRDKVISTLKSTLAMYE